MALDNKILIIDDNQDHAKLEKLALFSVTPNIITAYNINDATDILSKESFDAIVLDYSLNEDNGISLLSKLREQNNDTPVILVTAYGNEKVAVDAMKTGAYDYIIKSHDYLSLLPKSVKKAIEYHENIIKRKEAESLISEHTNINRILLDSIPHPAMLINKSKVIITANQKARELGASIGGYCWKDLRKGEFTPEVISGCDNISCNHCFADAALESNEPKILQELYFNNKFWEICWIPIDSNRLLVYMMDITDRKKDFDLLDKVNKCFLRFGTDSSKNIKHIIDLAYEIFSATYAFLAIENGEYMEITYSAGLPDGFPKKLIKDNLISYQSILTDTECPFWIHGIDANNSHYKNYNITSYFGCAIKIKGKPVGALGLFYEKPLEFSPNETNALSILANALGIELERKTSQEQIQRAADEWESTFNSINDMVSIHDSQFNIVKVNKSFIRRCKVKPENIIGRKCYEVFHGTDKPIDNCPHKKTIENAKSYRCERHEKKLGAYMEISASPIFNAAGKTDFSVHISKDITSRKKMEDDILKTRHLDSLGILAGGIAHDFNNLLTGIIGYLSFAKENNNLNVDLASMLSEAEKASLRARDLSRQLLTFSKGGAPVKKAEYIGELIIETAKFAISGSNAGIEFDIADDLYMVDIDYGQVSQVISNLIINAYQAMPSGGNIKIACLNAFLGKPNSFSLKEGNYVKIYIKDEGCGIPPENLDKIFDPYFTTKESGSGLGLAMCYSIIRKHSGKILVDSKAGDGTAFTIYLPASRKEPNKNSLSKQHVKAPQISKLSGKYNILIMDDEEIIRNLMCRILNYGGYRVETAKNGEEAISIVQEHLSSGNYFDAVIMDLTIPGGMGGKEAAEIIKSIDPNVKVIVSSGYSNDPIMADYQKYGFNGIVAKPYQIEELLTALRAVL